MAKTAGEIKKINELNSEGIQQAQDKMDLLVAEYDQVRATLDLAYRQQQAAEGLRVSEEKRKAQLEEIKRLKKAGWKISTEVTDELDEQEKLAKKINNENKINYSKLLRNHIEQLMVLLN